MASRTRMANDAWEALFRAQATVQRELLAADVWDDCSPNEYGVLYALSKAPDGLRITELGNDALLTQAGLSRLVARLEANGLVERGADPAAGRRGWGRPPSSSGSPPPPTGAPPASASPRPARAPSAASASATVA